MITEHEKNLFSTASMLNKNKMINDSYDSSYGMPSLPTKTGNVTRNDESGEALPRRHPLAFKGKRSVQVKPSVHSYLNKSFNKPIVNDDSGISFGNMP
jgi:hypothetical protein